MKQKPIPMEILVYQCDEADGEPVYAVARNVDEIPEEIDGQKIGVFIRNQINLFRVRRELKST